MQRGRDAQAPAGELGGIQREHQRGTDEDGADHALEITGLGNALEEERGAERHEQNDVTVPGVHHASSVRHRSFGSLRLCRPAAWSPDRDDAPSAGVSHDDRVQPRQARTSSWPTKSIVRFFPFAGPRSRASSTARSRGPGRTGTSSAARSAPEGAPNVLLVLIDDAGFGQPSTFGGAVSTPRMSRLADEGLRYNAFHVTALCSPTRAALLTGRNHHSVGFGSIGELSTGFPGYSAFFPKDSAPFPRVLQENGYSTAAFGKWHLTPDHQQGPAGPFDRWPNRLGFDYFWGFLGGEAGQYDPVITENQTTIGPPTEEGFYLPDAMTDKTIEWLHGVRAQEPDKPWFVYYSTGCAHAPHHVPPEWSDALQGPLRRGLGRLSRGDVRAPEAARRDPGRRGADAAQRGVPGVGLGPRGAAAAAGPPDGGLRGLPGERRLERRPRAGRDRGDGRARQHAGDLHLRRQRREHGGQRRPAPSTS